MLLPLSLLPIAVCTLHNSSTVHCTPTYHHYCYHCHHYYPRKQAISWQEVESRGDTYVLNLCDKKYEVKLGKSTTHCGWKDKHAPGLKELYDVCRRMQAVLKGKGPTAYLVLQCAAGKDNSGTAMASFLLFCGFTESVTEAMRLFHLKRMVGGKRVIRPAQVRYVQYIHRLVQGKLPHSKGIQLSRLLLQSVPMVNTQRSGCRPYAEVWTINARTRKWDLAYSTKSSSPKLQSYTNGPTSMVTLNLGKVGVAGDVRIVVMHEAFAALGIGATSVICSVQFHTGYTDGNGIEFKRAEVDDAGSPKKFDSGFGVRVECNIAGEGMAPSVPEGPWIKNPPPPRSAEEAQICFATAKEAASTLQDVKMATRTYSDSLSSSDCTVHRHIQWVT